MAHKEIINTKSIIFINDSLVMKENQNYYINYRGDKFDNNIDDSLELTLCKYLQQYESTVVPIKIIKQKQRKR